MELIVRATDAVYHYKEREKGGVTGYHIDSMGTLTLFCEDRDVAVFAAGYWCSVNEVNNSLDITPDYGYNDKEVSD
jgi:hypothetical protein